jgi:TonB family protein
MIFIAALAAIGCSTFCFDDGSAVAQEPTKRFDPLSSPKSNLNAEELWLDPLVFNSNNAYSISASLEEPRSLPSKDASYVGGNEQMISYLKEYIITRLAKNSGWLKPPTVHFTINTQGRTENVELMEPSGNEAVDKILIDVIQDMPKWNPAIDGDGQDTKQSFKFLVVQAGC